MIFGSNFYNNMEDYNLKNTLQSFQHEEFGSIRAIEIDGDPWFVGKDVADALKYQNTRGALRAHVDDEDRAAVAIHDGSQNRNMAIINESGLYSLILSSKLPAAKKFKRWVTSEILPSIRKHGAYATEDVLDDIESDPALAFELFRKLQADRGKIVALEAHVNKLTPKAQFFDDVLQSDNAMPVTLIAKDYGMSAAAFNNLLYHMGVQYKLGATWVLYQKYAKQGYTKSRTYYTGSGLTAVHTAWTQKGRLFLFELLAYYDIYPVDMHEQACFA